MRLMNDKRRRAILGLQYPPNYEAGGGIVSCDVTLDQIKLLIAEGFADPDEAQNDSPTIAEFVEFLVKYPKFILIGYVVDPERDDHRVSIEGIKFSGKLTKAQVEAFVEFAYYADEFTASEYSCRAWWD